VRLITLTQIGCHTGDASLGLRKHYSDVETFVPPLHECSRDDAQKIYLAASAAAGVSAVCVV
jgi:hypothetical protein